MNELKPCPFCGGKAELYESEAYNLKTETKEKDIRWFVMCEQCTALTCGALKKKQLRHGTGGRVMGDLICRQAAIDALHMHLMYRMGTDSNKKRLDEWINNLPSVQPEIVRCKDCKYADDDGVCQNSIGLVIQDDDDFCSRAERR